MRAQFLAVLYLMLCGCGRSDVLADEDVRAGNLANSIAVLPPKLVGSEEATIRQMVTSFRANAEQGRAKEIATSALQKVLFDPSSVQLLNLRSGRNGAVCGKYNAKNRYGAYVGFRDFVVLKDGSPVTSDNNDGLESLPANTFAAAYLSSCATERERTDYLAWMSPSPALEPKAESPDLPQRQEHQEPDEILDAPPASGEVSDEVTT